MNQRQCSWPGGKQSKRTSTLSNVTTNGNVFAVCSLSGRNAREGSPGRNIAIDSINGREKARNPFASTGVGKRSNYNRRCKVLFKNDLQRSAPQSPAGTISGLGSGTGNRVGKLNFTPDYKHLRVQGRLHSTQVTPPPPSPPPSLRVVRGTTRRNQGSTGFWRKKQRLDGKPGKRETN